MTFRTDLSDGWVLGLAQGAGRDTVPAAVRAALPIPATVPGCVHTDLLAAGLIPDPYLDRNELELGWIGRVPWVYSREVRHDPAAAERVALHFEGLDTIATVRVNGDVVARTENMHRRYTVPVTLRPGPNLLEVHFDSALEFGESERDRLGPPFPAQYPMPFNYVRKMACNFGWDWGPALVTAGIWRPVTLLHDPVIESVRPQAGRDKVTLDIRLHTPIDDVITATVGEWSAQTHVAGDRVTLDVEADNPELWWPRGFGEPHLYDAIVRVGGDEWHERIGFRDVRLDTTPDEDGTPFVIVVNDVPIPVRGANWIPDDCFPSRITPDRLGERLDQAVGANLNLLRIWGGGVYESRDFYRACDERGLLVWQDFLFACAAYPEERRLAREVEAEARDNVARLMPHPSLVLWNGNNENIWGHADWDWQQAIGDRPWGLGYYLEVLPRVVGETDPARPYWPGSPYSGSLDIHPNDDRHGPKHIWDVWNEADYAVYRTYRPRFVGEFGWQGPPTWSTLARSVSDRPLTPESPGVRHHQKAEDGDGKLLRGLALHFPPPRTMDEWHFAMQLNQARAVRLGIAHFRSLRPLCSGSIMWQLNDCWPVTSWAAIDGDGHKKPLWYALRAANRPRLLTFQPSGDGVTLVAVNDTPQPWRESLAVRRLGFDGTELGALPVDLEVAPLGVFRLALPAALAIPARPTAEFLVASPLSQGEQRAHWFFAEDRDLDYLPSDVDVAIDGATLTVTARTLVRDLCLFPDRLAPAAEVDDCLVTLLPGESRTLRITGLPPDLVPNVPLRTANDLVLALRGAVVG